MTGPVLLYLDRNNVPGARVAAYVCNTFTDLFLPAKRPKRVAADRRRVCAPVHTRLIEGGRARPRDIDNRAPRPSVFALT